MIKHINRAIVRCWDMEWGSGIADRRKSEMWQNKV